MCLCMYYKLGVFCLGSAVQYSDMNNLRVLEEYGILVFDKMNVCLKRSLDVC